MLLEQHGVLRTLGVGDPCIERARISSSAGPMARIRGNDLIRSVYFAIAACSTAGIVPTRTVRSDANVGFVGVFCLVGVPLYAACLGSFANILVQKTLARQTEDKLNENLTEAEV